MKKSSYYVIKLNCRSRMKSLQSIFSSQTASIDILIAQNVTPKRKYIYVYYLLRCTYEITDEYYHASLTLHPLKYLKKLEH